MFFFGGGVSLLKKGFYFTTRSTSILIHTLRYNNKIYTEKNAEVCLCQIKLCIINLHEIVMPLK